MKRLFPILFLLGCGSQGGDVELGVLRSPILEGVAEPGYTNTIQVIRTSPSGEEAEETCTGVVIAPHVVATALHCVVTMTLGMTRCQDSGATPDLATSVFEAGRMKVVLQQFGVDTPGITRADLLDVLRIEVLPDTVPGPLCGADIALLELSDAVSVTPASVRVDKSLVLGEGVTAVGYGNDGTLENSGQRRSRTGSSVLSMGATKKGDAVRTTEREWTMDTGGCAGDSGSPAFDQAGKLVGIMSRGGRTACVDMIYVRVDEAGVGTWLEETTSKISADRGDPALAWRPKTEPQPPTPNAQPNTVTRQEESGCQTTTDSNGWVGAIVALAMALRQGKRVPKSLA